MKKGIKIIGISAAIPKNIVKLEEYGQIYGEKYVRKVSRATGITSLRIASEDKTASDYCVFAAERLFSQLEYSKDRVDALIFISQSPDYIVPHTSAVMQNRLGLRSNIATFDLNYGCPGFVYGLLEAYSLISTGIFNNILLCCGDTMSSKINDKDKALKLVMGDGGAAILIEGTDDVVTHFKCYTDGSRAEKLIILAGGSRNPKKEGVTNVLSEDEDGNSRTKEDLYMDGMEVMKFALNDVAEMIEKLLQAASWRKEDVNTYMFHQANALVVSFLANKLNISLDKVPIGVENIGNTSSASIPIMLCKVFGKSEYINLGKNILCGFGTGLSSIACAMENSKIYIDQIKEV